MASVVDICNQALAELGEASISSLTEASPEARACNRHYVRCRNYMLERGHWSFAERVQPLALTTESPQEWAYAYAYPSNALTIRYIFRDVGQNEYATDYLYYDRNPFQGVKEIIRDEPFKVRQGDQDKVILADVPDAYVCFTEKIEDATRFSELFSESLMYYLASRIATSIPGGQTGMALKRELYQLHEIKFAEALAHDLNQQNKGDSPPSPAVLARL